MEFVEKIDLEGIITNANENAISSGIFADTQFLLSVIAIVFGFILSLLIVFTLKGGQKNIKKGRATTRVVTQGGEEETLDTIERNRDPGKSYQNEINKYVEKDPEVVAGILKNWMAED